MSGSSLERAIARAAVNVLAALLIAILVVAIAQMNQ
jgi:hypothetical protein